MLDALSGQQIPVELHECFLCGVFRGIDVLGEMAGVPNQYRIPGAEDISDNLLSRLMVHHLKPYALDFQPRRSSPAIRSARFRLDHDRGPGVWMATGFCGPFNY